MPSERFYVNAPLNGTVTIQDQELHHLANVMRIQEHEIVELVNGKGKLAKAVVISLKKNAAFLRVLEVHSEPPSAHQLLLAVPLMQPSKLEFIVEKCTELGAIAFYLYSADHSKKEHLSPNQLQRLNHIAISSMKQCGRLDLPPIELISLEQILALEGAHYFGDTRKSSGITALEKRAIFITGPERGFSKRELEFMDRTAKAVRLHHNILRADTAPIACAAKYWAQTAF